jgi:branched-chain amino acid transport system ATP-binding protein
MARTKAKRGETLAAGTVSVAELDRLAGVTPLLAIDDLHAGYGRMEVLHGVSLRVARGRSLCLIGPNGAGKSTVLNAIYGLARIFSGNVLLSGRDIGKLPPSDKLKTAKLAYVLQRGSVFPDMTVEENLLMGGYLFDRPSEARAAAELVLARYPALQARRRERANVLSGGERRLLEISRALIMDPEVVLIDEPSIGLEPRAIDMIFDMLRELRDQGGKTLILVEQNARKGLEFADIGYVLVAGRLVRAERGKELLGDPDMGRLFLGG